MKKDKIFDLSGISIIACDCLQAVICIFIDLFFISRLLRSPGSDISQNIVSIGLYYVVYYIVLAACYLFTGYFLRKHNKSILVSVGAILLTGVVLMVYFLRDSLPTFVPIIALVYGLGFGFFSSGFNGLTAETISSKHQVKFFAVKKIMFQVMYIVFPITLGAVADVSFAFVTYILFGVAVLLVIFSFLIRPKKVYAQEFHLWKFSKYMWQNRQNTRPLWLVYVQNFFRGASYDCFTTLITILVIRTFGSNTSLGMFQSIFTACSLVTMLLYLQHYRKKRAEGFILPTILLVTATIVCILAATNQATIVLFYGVYAVLNVILMSVSDSRRAGVVRVLSLHSHILESNALSEFFLGAGRVLGSVLIVLAGLFDGLVGGQSTLFLKIALGIVCILYVLYGCSLIWLEKALIKQDEEFKQLHSTEVIEKTED